MRAAVLTERYLQVTAMCNPNSPKKPPVSLAHFARVAIRTRTQHEVYPSVSISI